MQRTLAGAGGVELPSRECRFIRLVFKNTANGRRERCWDSVFVGIKREKNQEEEEEEKEKREKDARIDESRFLLHTYSYGTDSRDRGPPGPG